MIQSNDAMVLRSCTQMLDLKEFESSN